MRVRNYLVTHKKCDPQTDAVQNENITHPLHYITVNYFTANSISTKSERISYKENLFWIQDDFEQFKGNFFRIEDDFEQ